MKKIKKQDKARYNKFLSVIVGALMFIGNMFLFGMMFSVQTRMTELNQAVVIMISIAAMNVLLFAFSYCGSLEELKGDK